MVKLLSPSALMLLLWGVKYTAAGRDLANQRPNCKTPLPPCTSLLRLLQKMRVREIKRLVRRENFCWLSPGGIWFQAYLASIVLSNELLTDLLCTGNRCEIYILLCEPGPASHFLRISDCDSNIQWNMQSA